MSYAYWDAGAGNFDKNGQFAFFWNTATSALLVGPMASWIIFLAIKIFKSWYQKQQEKVALIKANSETEIQLLKAQIHPHFLFNTLNNIYSFTLTTSPLASAIVNHLNDTLSYMIRDCSAELVPLRKEIKLLRDYISIEQVRYGNRLDVQTEITGVVDDKTVSPLLLIPFLENSFKHGTSKMLDRPWVKLVIEVKDTELLFTLSNSKPPSDEYINRKKGIGLQNVKKRLALLYPTAHSLTIDSSETEFMVKLKTPLSVETTKTGGVIDRTPTSLTQNLLYAEQ
jgi:LytS/YehU family sensor histidine kinase